VLLGFGLLVSGKVGKRWCWVNQSNYLTPFQILNVQVPLIFKNIIDALNVDVTAGTTVWVIAGSMILGCMFHLFRGFESRNIVKITQQMAPPV
jgi:ABC transporter ATM